MKILFVGNSYTFYHKMPELFCNLARENGFEISVKSVTKGGRKLLSYKDSSDPITQQLDGVIAEGKYDVCFLQEQSVLPVIDSKAFSEGVECVVKKLEKEVKRFLLYATWGREEGCPKLLELGITSEEMNTKLFDAYSSVGKRFGFDLSPVGNHFLYVSKNFSEIGLYEPDQSHPSYLGSCLAALTHFYSVFGHLPEKCDSLSLPENVLEAFFSTILS